MLLGRTINNSGLSWTLKTARGLIVGMTRIRRLDYFSLDLDLLPLMTWNQCQRSTHAYTFRICMHQSTCWKYQEEFKNLPPELGAISNELMNKVNLSFWGRGQERLPNVDNTEVMTVTLFLWATSSVSMKNKRTVKRTAKKTEDIRKNAQDSKSIQNSTHSSGLCNIKDHHQRKISGRIEYSSTCVLCEAWEEKRNLVTNQPSLLACQWRPDNPLQGLILTPSYQAEFKINHPACH